MLEYYSSPTTDTFNTTGVPDWILHPTVPIKGFEWYSTRVHIDTIQRKLILEVYNKSGGRYRIKRQSDIHVLGIMRDIYNEYKVFSSFDIFRDLVVERALYRVMINITDTNRYRAQITDSVSLSSNDWQNKPHNPMIASQKGTKSLEYNDFSY